MLNKIKELDPETQIIIMTNYASLDTIILGMRAGAYDYLTKPFEDMKLTTAVVRRAADKIVLLSERKNLLRNLKEKTINWKKPTGCSMNLSFMTDLPVCIITAIFKKT